MAWRASGGNELLDCVNGTECGDPGAYQYGVFSIRPSRSPPRPRGPGEALEHWDGLVPAEAGVGDALAVDAAAARRRGPAGPRRGGSRASRRATSRDARARPARPIVAATIGWRAGSLPLLPWLQSTISRAAAPAASSSRRAPSHDGSAS